MANIYSLSVMADTRQLRVGMRDFESFGKSATGAATRVQRMQMALNRMRSSFRPMRGGLQQAGYQFGDFAVQVGAGQNVMVAFGQQASQLAGILGPGGAVLGAIIAVGSALGGAFMRSMGEAEEATESLSDRMMDLADSAAELTEAQRQVLSRELSEANRLRAEQIAKQSEELQTLNEQEQNRLDLINGTDDALMMRQRREGGAILSADRYREKLRLQNEELRVQQQELQANIDTLEQRTIMDTQDLSDFFTGSGEGERAAERAAQARRRMVESIREEAETLGMTSRELALYEARQVGATDAQIMAINSAYDRIEAYNEEQAAAKEAAKAEADFASSFDELQNKIDPVRDDMQKFGEDIAIIQEAFERGLISPEEADNMVNSLNRISDAADNNQASLKQYGQAISGIFGDAANQFGQYAQLIAETEGEQSRAYRDALRNQRNFAVANIAVNTAMAAAAALAPPPVGLGPVAGLPFALAIGGLGITSIGLQIGQTEAAIQDSLDGGARAAGGSVSAGRDYLVGENGPEIVRMGASGYVVPNGPSEQMMGGNGLNVTVVMQLSAGVSGTVRSEVIGMMPMIEQRTTQGVLQAISQGGSMSKAVGRRA